MLSIGQYIDLEIDSSRQLSAHITKMTGKAIQLNHRIWLPIRAVLSTGSIDRFRLAGWFHPDFLTRARLMKGSK